MPSASRPVSAHSISSRCPGRKSEMPKRCAASARIDVQSMRSEQARVGPGMRRVIDTGCGFAKAYRPGLAVNHVDIPRPPDEIAVVDPESLRMKTRIGCRKVPDEDTGAVPIHRT